MKSFRESYESLMAKPAYFKTLMNIWPPFFLSGIKVAEVSPDYKHIQIKLLSKFYNRNHFGTHFGGSLFAMLDPFFVFMVLNNLGRNYFVWDRSGEIEFIKPGKGTVTADLHISDSELEDIRNKTNAGEKYLPNFPVLSKTNRERLWLSIAKHCMFA